MSQEQVYAKLAEAYKFTPDEVANMTLHQQAMLLEPEAMSRVARFNTEDEFNDWKRRHGR